MSQDIRVVSLDLDGTLFRSDGTVTKATLACLLECKRRGMLLIFNTARPRKMIPTAFYDFFSEDYWVFSNGTTCLKLGQTIFHTFMDQKHIQAILHKLHYEYPTYFFSIESHGQIYTASSCDKTNEKYFAQHKKIDFIFSQEVNKIIIIAENKDFPVNEIEQLLHPHLRLLVTEKGKYVQVMPLQVSKLSAVEIILASLGLNIGHVLAFGDDLNDTELIKASGIGVAMGNADATLKELADHVTDSNDEDGVAIFLRNLFDSEISSVSP